MTQTQVTLNPTQNPSPVHIGVAGAGRGAGRMLPVIRAYNKRSDRFVLELEYIDPVPGRARTLVADAAAQGVPARWSEAPIEEYLAAPNGRRPAALVIHVDRPGALAQALRASVATATPVLAYILIRTPQGELYGMRMAFEGDDRALKELAALFFEELAKVVARSGASAIVGVRGRPEHVAVEPQYRAWFAEHMEQNISKLVAGLEPESSPLELTRDGHQTMLLMVRDHRDAWRAADALAAEVVDEPDVPIVRGEEFSVGEIGPDGIRIYRLRVRKLDGAIAVGGAGRLDRESIEEAERAALRAEISKQRPAFATD